MSSLTRGLEAEAYDRQYDDRELLDRVLLYFKPHRDKLILITLATVGMSLSSALTPILIAQGVAVMSDEASVALIPLLSVAIFVLGFAVWGFNWARRRLSSEFVGDVVVAMREDAFAATIRQDMAFFDEFSSGRIVSRISSDTQEFGEVMVLATDVINQLSVALILIVVLFTIEWRLALVVIAVSPLVAGTALLFRRAARGATRQSSRAIAEVNQSIRESVTGIRVAKNFRQEEKIYEEFSAVNDQSYAINVRKSLVLATIFPALGILSGFSSAALVYFGGLSAISGALSIAAWYLFVTTVDRFWFPVTNLSAFWSQFQAGLAAVERVFGLIDVQSQVRQTSNQAPGDIRGEIIFENLEFRYSEQEQVLNGFSLHIQPGESVALVGHTGAGKSSIIKLIARFYEFQAGSITVDGLDIRDLNLTLYRQQVGLVSQVPFLFDGSVAENIRYGRPQATDEDILAMAQRIGDGEWLQTLPAGLHSPVGERGSRLSMGQRQLVALTRVLVQRPSIFILDEATASIDPFTESQIQQALNLIMGERTAVIIAHRLSTIRSADRIIVLEGGRIIEEGNHLALIEAGGHYAELYNTYFRHQSAEYYETVRQWREQRTTGKKSTE